MFALLFAFFMALTPTHAHKQAANNAQVTTMDDAGDDSGGDTGHIPTKPPKP